MFTWRIPIRVEIQSGLRFNPGWDSIRVEIQSGLRFNPGWDSIRVEIQPGTHIKAIGRLRDNPGWDFNPAWKKLKNACKQFNPAWKGSSCTLQNPFSKNYTGGRKTACWIIRAWFQPASGKHTTNLNPGWFQLGLSCHVNTASETSHLALVCSSCFLSFYQPFFAPPVLLQMMELLQNYPGLAEMWYDGGVPPSIEAQLKEAYARYAPDTVVFQGEAGSWRPGFLLVRCHPLSSPPPPPPLSSALCM